MMKRASLVAMLVGLIIVVCMAFRVEENSVYLFNHENVLGTSLQLKISAQSEKIADEAEQLALLEIDRLAGILSTYDSLSEISRWQKTLNSKVNVSPELFEVLDLFDTWKEKTGGALSASIAAASNLWKKAEVEQQVPGKKELSEAVASMNQPEWLLDKSDKTAMHTSGQPLVLNSFVKSYIIRKASDKIMSVRGVLGAVTNIGGDIVITGTQTEEVWISNPRADAENDAPVSILTLHGRSIATSGNYRRGFHIGTQTYSHIIDPRTAIPASSVISATIVAENATDAGALATAFNILQPEESSILAEQMPGVEYQIITRDGKEIVSAGWETLKSTNNNRKVVNKMNPGVLLESKLIINFELATFEGRFRRPFVAVWIENKKSEQVKTLALWYNKPRWLPDLKRWYASNQSLLQDLPGMQTISSATRSAGKYNLTWDGLDAQGKPSPAGSYTVYIEAAREHGTYQLIKQDIDWNGKPIHVDLKGGTEITSASLDFTK